MLRTVDASEGVALLGTVRAGPLGFSVPAILDASPPDGTVWGPIPLSLSEGPATEPGRRSLVLRAGQDAWPLSFSVPAPEVSGVTGGAESIGEGAWIAHWPLPPEDAARLRDAGPDLVVLGNARALLLEGERFVEALRDVRQIVGGQTVLWAPRVALPHRLALLVYLGVDLLDTTEAEWQALDGRFFDLDLGTVDEAIARRERLCRCPECRDRPDAPTRAHARALLAEEMHRVRTAVRLGRLRELVEARQTAEPLLAEILRYADRTLAGLLEERTPVVSTASRSYVLKESHRRPEILRFRARLLERYRPPPSKRVLLLVPCSRTKPYRNSRSHRRFLGALEGLSPFERLHVVSVTSPLGLVPRELEDTYPARNYDIPVTGEWDEEERSAVRDALRSIHQDAPYVRTIFHLDPEEYRFLRDLGIEGPWTMTDHRSTSPAALAALRSAVSSALDEQRPVDGGPLTVVREELRSVAAFQFGAAAADALFRPPVRLAGRPWFQRLTDGAGTDLATWKEPRGLFQLTVAGAERILPAHALEVEIDPAIDGMGDLFTPGVRRADPLIRAGDAVVLTREGRVAGVGEAALPGPLMLAFSKGVAVWVRHRAARSPPPPTPT